MHRASGITMRPTRINVRGQCERYEIHDAHLIPLGMHPDGVIYLQDCPGQHVECRNCDDRKCMSCVLRYWHDACEDDCPMCCGDEPHSSGTDPLRSSQQ